jgi:transcriptional regulator with XRE-family HTH domain
MARTQTRRIGEELLDARRNSGLSARVVARAAGMSHTQLYRLESNAIARPTLDQLARQAAVLGLRLAIRLYPEGEPIRDAGHHRLLERMRERIHPTSTWHTEVPIGLPGDLRSWDAETGTRNWRVRVEAETHLGDVQALERRIALKRRDSGDPPVILLVAGTRHNLAVLRAVRESLRDAYPLDTREVLAALGRGAAPGRSGMACLAPDRS